MDLRPTAHSRKLQMLVVDDDPSCRESLVEFFLREGFLVECATRGDQALEMFRSLRVDVSVMDVNMPGLTGPQVLQKLTSAGHPPMVPPTLLMSSDRAAEELLRDMLDVPVGFIPKPIRLDALRRSVESLLRRPGGPWPPA